MAVASGQTVPVVANFSASWEKSYAIPVMHSSIDCARCSEICKERGCFKPSYFVPTLRMPAPDAVSIAEYQLLLTMRFKTSIYLVLFTWKMGTDDCQPILSKSRLKALRIVQTAEVGTGNSLPMRRRWKVFLVCRHKLQAEVDCNMLESEDCNLNRLDTWH